MQWYPWLTPYYRQMVHQHQHGFAAPVMLLQVQQGLGIDLLIQAIGRWLLCLKPNDTKVCGVCHSCKLMLAGNHPDWLVLAAAEGKHSLGVDAVRETLGQLNYFPAQGRARVIWIKSAHQLTEAAVNALLKTLEEPPSDCWFLLSTETSATLPATLRSRCRIINVPVPAEAQGLQWLKQYNSQPETHLLSALRLSAGAPAAALQLLTAERWQQREQFCQCFRQSMLSRQPVMLLPELRKTDPVERIHWLMSLLLDGVKISSHQPQWLSNPDKADLVELLQQTMAVTALWLLLSDWSACLKTLQLTPAVNLELLLTEALLKWEQQLSCTG